MTIIIVDVDDQVFFFQFLCNFSVFELQDIEELRYFNTHFN